MADAPAPMTTTAGTATGRREFADGAVAMLPFVMGYAPFVLIVGAALAESPHPDAGMAATWLLYGGSVHLAVLRLLEEEADLGAIVLTGLLLNTRLLLYSATVAPLWRGQRRSYLVLAGALLVEPSWTLARSRHERPGSAQDQRAYYLGAALTLWGAWSTLVLIGMVAGAGLGTMLALDLAVPICLLGAFLPSLAHRPGRCAAASSAAVAFMGRGLPAGTSIVIAVGVGLLAGHLADRSDP